MPRHVGPARDVGPCARCVHRCLPGVAAEAGAEGVVCINLSSRLSATIQSAQAAAKESDVPVRIVDSLNVSLGQG